MTFPADLPGIIEYRNSVGIIRQLPRTKAESVGGNGNTNANVIHPTIPPGVTAWRVPPSIDWLPLDQLPPHWMPFLNRRRGSAMDPRPPIKDAK
jgi:hypothetical protein